MPWGSEKGFYAVRCMVQSLAIRGFKRLAVRRQPAVLADCKVVGMRMMRMSTLQTCMLEKHMSESVWWCFLSSGVPMGSHMSVVTCMKVCVLADSGSGLPMLKVMMDYPIWAARWSYAWNSGRPTLALRIAVHVRGCGWPWLERPGFSGVRGQLGRLLKDSKPSSEWAGVAMCFRSCGQKSGHFRRWKLGCRAYFLEVRAQRIHSCTTSCVENLSTSSWRSSRSEWVDFKECCTFSTSWKDPPQGGGWWLLLAVWRQPAVLADVKVVGMRMMRMSTLQTCMLEKHMSESAWW